MLCLSSLSSWLPLLYCFLPIVSSRHLICFLSLFASILNYHCLHSCFCASSILSPLSHLIHHLFLLHVDLFSRSSFNCVSVLRPRLPLLSAVSAAPSPSCFPTTLSSWPRRSEASIWAGSACSGWSVVSTPPPWPGPSSHTMVRKTNRSLGQGIIVWGNTYTSHLAKHPVIVPWLFARDDDGK